MKRKSPRDKVTEKMAEKSHIDPKELCYVEDPSVEEKLVLELASEIHYSKPDAGVAVSWEAQVEAAEYYNQHGFIEALTRMNNLRSLRG